MNTCSKMNSFIMAYLEDELDHTNRSLFEEHIEACEFCKNETNEIKRVLYACNSIQDEELPEAFQHQLHLKLLSINNIKTESRKNNKLILLCNSEYFKIVSSVAAIVVFALILRGIVNMEDAYHKNTSNATPLYSNQNSIVKNDTLSEPTEKGNVAENSIKRASCDGVAISTPSEKKSVSEAAQSSLSDNSARGSDVSSTDNIGSNVSSFTMKAAVSPTGVLLTLKNNSISIEALDPVSETVKLKELALSYGAEFPEVKPTDEAGSYNNKALVASPKIIFDFKIPVEQYENFILNLKKFYGTSKVSIGNTNNANVEQRIISLKNEIADLDKKISKEVKLQKTGTSDNLDAFKITKESKQKDLDILVRDTNFVSISVSFKA